MGKPPKKSLEDLKKDASKKDIKPIEKKDMKDVKGGKDASKKNRWNNGCGGIVPQ
ncbi:MAG: hypothetical protein SH848_21415 [Saprospiraceae bacterium]|nr:hypothetical protein [Saprospiraceae bacterium]MDZ4706503.1 hypothetical protein [Saprospiraceae bacterium]